MSSRKEKQIGRPDFSRVPPAGRDVFRASSGRSWRRVLIDEALGLPPDEPVEDAELDRSASQSALSAPSPSAEVVDL